MLIENILSTSLLEFAAGFGYLIGHLLLSRHNIWGWILKIIGGFAWIVFLFMNQNYIFSAVTIVIVLAFIYGFYKWKIGKFDLRTRIDVFFELLAVLVAIIMIFRLAILGKYNLGFFVESIIVVAEISGTILLARKKVLGWYAYIVMSLLVGVLVIFVNTNPALVLGVLEMSAVYFYIRGIKNFAK